MKSSLFFVFFVFVLSSCSSSSWVMPWMCLERCGEDISDDLRQILQHSQDLRAASFEAYDLGPNGKLLWNNFTEISNTLHSSGLKTFAMITTVNLDKVKQLVSSPEALSEAAVEEAEARAYSGYNIDFEPNDVATDEDRENFAVFVDNFSKVLRSNGLLLGVDLGHLDGETSLYNFSLLAHTQVDHLCTMGTYCGEFSLFSSRLDYAVSTIGLEKLCVGLMTVNPNTGQPFSEDEIKQRFQLIQEKGVKRVAVWDAPIPDNWWKYIQNFAVNG